MPITYTIAIDRDDDGSFAEAGEIITPDVLSLRWRLGMAQPYDNAAEPGWAAITVWNPDGAYSPELTTLLPGKRVRIQSHDGVTTRTHFTGFIVRVEPVPGEQGAQTSVIHARTPDTWLADNRITLPPLVNVFADAVITAVLQACHLRHAVLDGYLIIGEAGMNMIGRKLFGEYLTRQFETGKTRLAYVGDTWGVGIPADAAIRQLTETERGRFFINRAGEAVFYHRHHTLLNLTNAATFADDMAGLVYGYGADIVNHISVTLTPRSTGAPHTLLWSLGEPMALASGVVRRLTIRFQDANANSVGALSIDEVEAAANTAANGAGTDVTHGVQVRLIQSGSSAATLEIENPYSYTVYVRTLAVYGQPITPQAPLTVEEHSVRSRTFYGHRRLSYDFPALNSLDDAVNLARYELERRDSPRGRITALQTDATQHPAETLSLTLFDRIGIAEAQTGHEGDYVIVAEEHVVDKGGTRHRVNWLLEPADDDRFFIVGVSLLDGTRTVMY
jgi:hypothetical protein